MESVGNKTSQDLQLQMRLLGEAAKKAADKLTRINSEIKTEALFLAAEAIRNSVDSILAANAADMQKAAKRKLSNALLDRLALDNNRVSAMAEGIESIANLPDPVGVVVGEWDRPNGLKIQRVRVPLGVIGIIYELSLIHI